MRPYCGELQSDAESVVVIGGGFIGLEAAAVARAQGKSVTVVEAADRLIGRAVAPVVSDFYRDAHPGRGVEIRLGARWLRLAGEHNRVRAVELSDGTRIPADLVIVGIGVIRAPSWRANWISSRRRHRGRPLRAHEQSDRGRGR